MNRYEKAYYDKLPKSLSHEEKLEFMRLLGPKFEVLPPATKKRILKQAYADRSSQFVVRKNGKLVSVPTGSVAVALRRLGFKIEAELTLLK
jgi:hypothetical protein